MLQSTIGKILIVEDDSGLAHLQAARLGRLGHVVTKVPSAVEALEICQKELFDLYILDYALGGDLTGVQLYQVLRERGATGPAILVTGFDDPKIIVESIRIGVRDFIPKNAEVLDTLPIAVERVLHQVNLERELVAANAVREKQELLQTASEAARLAYWSWDLKTDRRKWNGAEEIFGLPQEVVEGTYQGFMPNVYDEDRDALLEVIEQARLERSVLEHEFRILRADQTLRWILARGRFYYDRDGAPARMAGIVVDISERKESQARLEQSYMQIQSLNDRLQLSVAETHHRVKNSLQGVISLVNLQLHSKGILTGDDVKKIISHVQGVASLHDVLSENSKVDGLATTISLDILFRKLLSLLTKNYVGRSIRSELDQCTVSAKQGATLSVVLNELVSNALKHGSGPIYIKLRNEGEKGTLLVQNEGSQFPENFRAEETTRTGLLLLSMLCRTDLGHEPEFRNLPGNCADVCITFPIIEGEYHASQD